MGNVDCGECPHVSDGCQGFCEKIEISVSRWDANWHMEEFYEHKHGDYVRVADFYAAQSELAALREELADARLCRSISEGEWMEALTAAEQRNAELVELLRDIYNQNELSGFDDRRILEVIEPQPTESVASE